jgi:hypothetical protein
VAVALSEDRPQNIQTKKFKQGVVQASLMLAAVGLVVQAAFHLLGCSWVLYPMIYNLNFGLTLYMLLPALHMAMLASIVQGRQTPGILMLLGEDLVLIEVVEPDQIEPQVLSELEAQSVHDAYLRGVRHTVLAVGLVLVASVLVAWWIDV